jgi:hypothetical protein
LDSSTRLIRPKASGDIGTKGGPEKAEADRSETTHFRGREPRSVLSKQSEPGVGDWDGQTMSTSARLIRPRSECGLQEKQKKTRPESPYTGRGI